MIDARFVIVGSVVGMWGTYLYLRDTLRGTTQPNRVTWILWAALPLLIFAVEVDEGVGLRALMTFTTGFGPLLIFAASFWNPRSVWRIGRLEYVCGGLSALGLLAWVATRHGTVALVTALAADALAAVPTLRKGWVAPESETPAAYVTAAVSAALTLLTVNRATTAVVAFPLYILAMASLESAILLGRLGPRLAARRAGPPVAGALGDDPGP